MPRSYSDFSLDALKFVTQLERLYLPKPWVSLGSEIGVICQGGQVDMDVGDSDMGVGDPDTHVGDPDMAGTLEDHHNAQLVLR